MSQPPEMSDPYKSAPQEPGPHPYQAPGGPAPQFNAPEYGAAPQYGAPAGGGPTVMPPRPPTVRAFVWLMIVGAVMTVVSTIYGLATLDVAADEASEELAGDPDLDGVDVAGLVEGVGGVFVVLFGLIGVALWLLFAWLVNKGHNWARITGTVLGALNLLASLLGLGGGGVNTLISLIVVLICIGGLVVLWLPATNQWFRQVADHRRGTMYA